MTSAKAMQQASIEPPPATQEARIRVTLRTKVGYEYHQVYAESVVRDLVNPEVPDGFIEIEIADQKVRPAVRHRFLHTSNIAEVDIHDEMEVA